MSSQQPNQPPPPPAVRVSEPLDGELIIVKTGHCLDKAADRASVFNLVNAPATPVQDCLGELLMVTGYLCHPAEREDEQTGELVRWTRTVLVLDSGKTVALGSEGAPRQLRALERAMGPAPWPAGIGIVIRAARSKRGYTYHYLEVVP